MSQYTILDTGYKRQGGIYRILKPFHHAGLFSYVWVCLQSMYENPGEKYYIDMRKFSTYYDPTITHTDNVWEYYWEQPDTSTCPDEKDIIATGIWNAGNSGYCDLSPVTPERKLTYHNIIKKNMRLHSHIKEKIEKFVDEHDWKSKKVLGVHCRATDSYLKNSVDLYMTEIESIEKDYDEIFVMVDDVSYLNTIKEKFGGKVVSYNTTTRSGDGVSVWDHPQTPYKNGEDVIVEAYIMSHVKFMICARSNVTGFSKYLNANLPYVNLDIKYGNIN